MAFPDKNYTLGKGRLYFGRYAPGTRTVENGGALRYLGNSPEFSFTSESESLDHFDSDNGIRTKDDSVVTDLTRSGNIVVDHISPENLADWLQGVAGMVTQTALTGQTYVVTAVKKGRRYQLGQTTALPTGIRNLTTVTASDTTGAAVPLVLNTDFTVDLATGGVIILPGSTTVVDGDTVTFTVDAAASSYFEIESGSEAVLEGELFFQATNPKGQRIDYRFPYAQLRPDGDFALKGDDWQTLGFGFEALKRDDNTPAVIATGAAGITL